MKKSVYLLFLLLIGCAPVATTPPTFTALPPTSTSVPTITPSPTATPEPTFTTSPPFQETAGGVQVFENGKYVTLNPPNEGVLWKVDGMKVVLETDENGETIPFAQMTLENGFVDTDGDNLLNVAKYDMATKKWIPIAFSFARPPELMDEYNPRNYDIRGDFGNDYTISITNAILGFRFNPENSVSIEVLIRNKSRVVALSIDEIGAYDARPGKEGMFVGGPKGIKLNHIVQMLDSIKLIDPVPSGLFSVVDWTQIRPGTKPEDCENLRSNFPPNVEFFSWCKKQVSKGDSRHIPTKEDLEQMLLFSESCILFEGLVTNNPNEFWNLVKSGKVADLWITFMTIQNR